MKTNIIHLLSVVVAAALLAGCGKDKTPTGPNQPQPQVIIVSGNIQAKVDEFRQLLGDPNNGGTPGTQSSGRRELNWDGVPDSLAAPFFLPADYFNATNAPRARGTVLTTPGTGVQVSADDNNPSNAAPRFGNVNSTYGSIFQTFSPQRLFSPMGSNIVDLKFYVPGSTTRAVVRYALCSWLSASALRLLRFPDNFVEISRQQCRSLPFLTYPWCGSFGIRLCKLFS